MDITFLLPLLTTAAGLGYELIWGIPGRERLAREERERREREYQRWLQEYQRFLEAPIIAYPPEAIELAYRGVEEALARQLAGQRIQLLRELEARGVRGEGIAGYPLTRLEEERLFRLAEARRALELERLLAERQARLAREEARRQFLATQLGIALQPLERAREMEFMLPFYQQAILYQLLGQMGAGLGYAAPGLVAALRAPQPTPTPTPTPR